MVERGRQPDLGWPGPVTDGLGRGAQPLAFLRGAARQVLRGSFQQQRAFGQHELDIDAGLDLDLRVMLPCGDRIRPSLHGERPVTWRIRGELGAPAVEVRGTRPGHVSTPADPPSGIVEHGGGGHGVVPLPEDRCGDLERLTHDGLGGVAPTFDRGGDIEDRDSSSHRG